MRDTEVVNTSQQEKEIRDSSPLANLYSAIDNDAGWQWLNINNIIILSQTIIIDIISHLCCIYHVFIQTNSSSYIQSQVYISSNIVSLHHLVI